VVKVVSSGFHRSYYPHHIYISTLQRLEERKEDILLLMATMSEIWRMIGLVLFLLSSIIVLSL
jgi:hypothetical protein